MTGPRPHPAQGSVEIWLLDGSGQVAWLDAIPLDPAEEARAARMATDALGARLRRRRRFLRAGLAAYLGREPGDVPLAVGDGGKPFLPRDAGLHFSLSHSGDISVLAVGADPLGIDLERRKTFDRLPDLAAHACSPRERAAIAAAPDATAAFLDRWVLKEAILKCRGSGLVDDLPGVDPGDVPASPIRWQGLALQSLPAPPGTVDLHLALAVAGPLHRVTWHGLDAGALPAPAV